MKTLTYLGPQPGLRIPHAPPEAQNIERGKTYELPDNLADELLQTQPNSWKAGAPRAKKMDKPGQMDN